jgi:hypothetical protein
MARWASIALVVLGVGLVAAPFAFDMFDRAPKGATMLDDFEPFMTTPKIEAFQADIDEIDAAVTETDGPIRRRLDAAGPTAAAQFATFDSFAQDWPKIHGDFDDLLTRVHRSVGGYQAVAALPPFDLFPWFFVVPGLLLAASGGLGLLRPGVPALWLTAAVLGIALVLAPVAFGMFTRAPKGGRMMDDFESIMTTERVHGIQGYFGSMAVGEGAIRTSLIPALAAQGLGPADIAREYPAVARLEGHWVTIINDMTPMLGAMSDNVSAYQGLTALPPFALFSWFFVVPGVLATAIAAAGRPRPLGPDAGTPPAPTPSKEP